MPRYTIEVTYHLPVYRRRNYSADTPAEACRLAIEDDWWEYAKEDVDSSGESYVTGIWLGANAAGSGPEIPVPSHFDETIQRQADHFETLLGLLRILAADLRAGRDTDPLWLDRADYAVSKAEAILAGARDPDVTEGGDADA